MSITFIGKHFFTQTNCNLQSGLLVTAPLCQCGLTPQDNSLINMAE